MPFAEVVDRPAETGGQEAGTDGRRQDNHDRVETEVAPKPEDSDTLTGHAALRCRQAKDQKQFGRILARCNDDRRVNGLSRSTTWPLWRGRGDGRSGALGRWRYR